MMGGFGFDILLFLAVLMIACVTFIGWIASMILRAVWYGFRWIFGIGTFARARSMAQWRWCRRVRCGAVNPLHASYCRRCGMPLVATAGRNRERAAA